LQQELRLPVHIAEDPLSAVARGTGIVLEQFDNYKNTLLSLEDHASL
jgi:rod shape-determining protein MreB